MYKQDEQQLLRFLDVLYSDLPPGRWIPVVSRARKFIALAAKTPEEVVSIVRRLYKQSLINGLPDDDVYVGVNPTSTVEERTAKKTGRTYLVAKRDSAGIAEARMLFADIDAKNEPGGSVEEILLKLNHLIKTNVIPRPSALVASGNGIHAYWRLDRWLPRDQWVPLASRFEAHLVRAGLPCDSITKDIARILRPPETWNCKIASAPRKVILLHADSKPFTSCEVSVDDLWAKLGTATGAVALPPRGGGAASPSPLASGLSSQPATPAPVEDVLHLCPTLGGIAARGGEGDSEPLWNLALYAAAAYGEPGRALAHRLSCRHAEYDPAATDRKFDAKLKARSPDRDLGWPTCEAFAAHSPLCDGCAFRSVVKSPLSLRPSPPEELPHGYLRQGGKIWRVPSAEGGEEPVPKLLLSCDIANVSLEQTEEGQTLAFDVMLPKTQPSRLRLPVAAINLWRDRALTVLGRAGVSIPRTAHSQVQRFFVAFVDLLQTKMAAAVQARPFGWTPDGFAVAGVEYLRSGGVKRIPTGDQDFVQFYEPVGTFEKWKAAADFLTSWRRIDLQAMLAVAFAAPLIDLIGLAGTVVSAYGPTGAQKSCAVQVMSSVWGAPRPTTLGVQNTINSVLHKFGLLRNLPLAWDEVEYSYIAEYMPSLIFQFTQGIEKARLTSDINLRRQGTWSTMILIASNFSVQSILAHVASNESAIINRVFEFEVTPMRGNSPYRVGIAAALKTFDALHRNHGHAGRIYAAWLASRRENLTSRLQDVMAAMEADSKALPEERFWLAAAAAMFLGAANAKHLGLVDFDLGNLYTFLLKQLKLQRRARIDFSPSRHEHYRMAELLQRYINYCREKNRYLVTDVFASKHRQAVTVMLSEDMRRSLRAPSAHLAQSGSRLRLLPKDFRRWLLTEHQAPKDVVELMRKYAAMQTIRATWCGGTDWSGVQGDMYELDLSPATELGKLCSF